jgi:hypothetical protein
MKKKLGFWTILATVLVFSFAVVGCGNDPENGGNNNGDSDVVLTGTTWIGTAEGYTFKFEFTSNTDVKMTRTEQSSGEIRISNFTYIISDNNISIRSGGTNDVLTGIISVNNMTFTESDGDIITVTKQ